MKDQTPDIPEAEHVKYSRRERAIRTLQMASGERCSICGILCVTLPDGSYTDCLCTPEAKAERRAWLNQPKPKDERGWLTQFFKPALYVDRKKMLKTIRKAAIREQLRLDLSRRILLAPARPTARERRTIQQRSERIYNLRLLAAQLVEERIDLPEAVPAYQQITGSKRPIVIIRPGPW